MRSLHLTILIFCQILLASFILYSTVTSASPLKSSSSSSPVAPQTPSLAEQQQQQQQQKKEHLVQPLVSVEPPVAPVQKQQVLAAVVPAVVPKDDLLTEKKAAAAPVEVAPKVTERLFSSPSDAKAAIEQQQQQQAPKVELRQPVASAPVAPQVQVIAPVAPVVAKPAVVENVLQQRSLSAQPVIQKVADKVVPVVEKAPLHSSQQQVPSQQSPLSQKSDVEQQNAPLVVVQKSEPIVAQKEPEVQKSPASPVQPIPVKQQQQQQLQQESVVVAPLAEPIKSYLYVAKEGIVSQVEPLLASKPVASAPVVVKEEPVVVVKLKQGDLAQLVDSSAPLQPQALVSSESIKPSEVRRLVESPAALVEQQTAPQQLPAAPASSSQPKVKGGLGPLHLLAATLCSYQPEKLVADETLNLLYSQRAALRKSLFDFMSLKFTNLEKLSSRLNSGFASLEVVPPKKGDDASGQAPSHGWPVVGVCTAHDLKLMAEAAYCEANANAAASAPVSPVGQSGADKPEVKVSNGVAVNNNQKQPSARSLDSPTEQSSSAVVSKLLHVNDVKEAPVISESSQLASHLNLTQQQLVNLQQQVIAAASQSPLTCRRNALRLTKALFNHLAEDQKQQSESWPKLYTQLNEDECGRKRMIDIVTALAGFRGESTSIRRDNVEYAFAMDDLRSKVLESEVTAPLTFDKQFIEVEQFLQQSVKLMLANIDPQRARLTSERYRSLMAGSSGNSADDQCIELHQRLLVKNYPTDCNPNQFGQLPDVLRMTASSLALYSIEQELAKHSAKYQDYPTAPVAITTPVKEDVNECIANLVAS